MADAPKTLVTLCLEWGEPIDAGRELLRKRPDLAGLARRIGGTRCFDPAAAKKVRAALAAR